MRRILCIVCFLWLCNLRASATHIFGGELYYTHVSGMTYDITLALYGDCAAGILNTLYASAPDITIMKGVSTIGTVRLAFDASSGNEITPVCPAKKDSTTCTVATSAIPGVRKFIYTGSFTFPGAASDYKFVFSGALNGGSSAGRSNNITNIVNPGGNQQLYLIAELNNVGGPNSSPRFTTIPTPFYCVNVEQQYNQGAIDQDGDSLVFSLAPALVGGFPATYVPGFTETYPISTINGLFDFNTLNGQISFTPDILQNGVVVNKVYEYRSGSVTGTSMREMTFIVLDNCQNIPPEGTLDTSTVSGAVPVAGNVFNVCEGDTSVSFSYPVSDPDGDTLDLTFAGLPPGAGLQINNNHTPNPVINFNWNIVGVPPGIYNFFVTIKDRHCPLSISETRGFTIRIVRPGQVSYDIIKPTDCAHKALVKITATNGLTPRKIVLKQGAVIVKTYIDSVGTIIDSLETGSYTLTAGTDYLLCSPSYNMVIADSGVYPFSPAFDDEILCRGAAAVPLNAIPRPGAIIHWYDSLGNSLSAAPVPVTASIDTMYWLVSQQYLVCESRKDTVKVVIAPKPEVSVLSQPGNVCIGDQIFLQARGAESYHWMPEDKIFYEPDSTPFIRVYEPSAYSVIGSNETGCNDTVAFRFDNIERCCNFSYPTAFTPNGDTKNDTWHPVMYGNHTYYELSIYNRWGARLFHSFTPGAAWNGTYDGQVQEIGTYYYFLKARCVTGREELQKGEFVLLR